MNYQRSRSTPLKYEEPLSVRMPLYGDVPAGTIPSVEDAESLDCAKSPDCSVGLVNGTVRVRLAKQLRYPPS